MIARAEKLRAQTLQDRFLELLPQIQAQASLAFRHEKPERREELIAETIANSFCAYQRLADRGKADLAYATPLAQFAIRQVRTGRRVGSKLNVLDVSSKYAQRAKGFNVERLDRYDSEGDDWREVVVEDKSAGPDQIAATRIDFAAWLKSLPRTKRRIAKTLATGESTKKAARKHRVSPGRISQVRRELMEAWESFIGDDQESLIAAPA